MYDNTLIQTGFSGLVGYRQSANPLFTQLDADLLVTKSGRCFNDLPGIDFELIEYAITQEYADVNDYLTQVNAGCISTMLDKFISQNKSKWSLKEVLENTVAFKSQTNYIKNIPSGRAIGFEIKPFDSNNMRLELTSLGLFGDGTGQYTIYLYRANKKEPITSQIVNVTADNEDWTAVTDFIHYYQSITEGAGQSLYLLYYEYDATKYVLGVQVPSGISMYQQDFNGFPLNYNTGYLFENANTDNNIYRTIRNKHKFCKITPVVFQNGALNFDGDHYNLPNLQRIEYTNMYMGLNFRFNVKCDLTHLLLDQYLIFAEAYQYMVAIKLLWDGVATTNMNHNVLRKKDDWVKFANKYERYLYGYDDDKLGFVPGIFTKLGIDLSNLDRICLPGLKNEPVSGRSSYK